ncbi:MAG: TadE/TadG family type IV pilus assembly protein [Alphaproteobacteria bacterium]
MKRTISMFTQIKFRLNSFRRDSKGIAAVEFAITVPVLFLIVAATCNFGSIIYAKYNMEKSLSAASNYVLINSSLVSSSTSDALALNIANIVSHTGNSSVSADVLINNGSAASVGLDGTVSTSGTASIVDSCYCPNASGGSLTWGSSMTCGGGCPDGSTAGRFVQITITTAYAPIIPITGMASSSSIRSTTLVRTL